MTSFVEPLEVKWIEPASEEGFSPGPPTQLRRKFVCVFNRTLNESVEDTQALQLLYNERGDWRMYAPHPTINTPRKLWVTERDFQIRANTPIVDATIDYSSDLPEQKDPTRRPATLRYGSNVVDMPYVLDAFKKLITTTAGEPIYGLTRPVRHRVLILRRAFSQLPQWVDEYEDAINSDRLQIDGMNYDRYTLKVNEIQIGDQEEEWISDDTKVTFRWVEAHIEHNKNTWRREYPNAGFYELAPSRGVDSDGNLLDDVSGRLTRLVRIRDDNQHPTDKPSFLNEFGRRPRIGEIIENGVLRKSSSKLKWPLDPEDILYVKRFTNPILPFRALPFPTA